MDKNSFKELAGIADAWLGWSWEEYDTSDSDDNSTDQILLNSGISELSEVLASGPVQTVVLGPTGDMDVGDSKKKKHVSHAQPRANITSTSRTETETSSPTKHRRDRTSLGSPKRKRRSHSASRESRKSEKKKMDDFKAPESQLKEIPDEEEPTEVSEYPELATTSTPVVPTTSDYILELQQQLQHGELTEEEFAVRLREDSEDLFSSPVAKRSVLPLGYVTFICDSFPF